MSSTRSKAPHTLLVLLWGGCAGPLIEETPHETGSHTDTAVPPPEPPAYLSLFDEDQFPTFELEIPPSSWQAIEDAGPDNQNYQRGTFKYGDLVLENVGIRLKGRASFRGLDEKAAFKIKFGEFIEGQRFLGLRRLTLNNQVQDPSAARERIGYQLFRAAGLDAPLCNSARVYVNGEYFGVYANVQSIDKTFIQDHYPDETVGNLYDTINDVYFTDLDRSRDREQSGSDQEQRFQLETNKNEGDLSGLTAAIDAVYNDDKSQGWYTGALESHLDLDQFLKVGAVQAIIADWDGFFGARNNYKIYHESGSDHFVLYPWGIDQTYGMQSTHYQGAGYCIDGSNSQRVNALLFVRCKAEPGCWSRYVQEVEAALEVFNSVDWLGQIDRIEAQIGDAVKDDPRSPYGTNRWQKELERLADFIRQRPSVVAEQLAGGTCP